MNTESPHFDGPDYSPALDQKRLTGQILRIYNLMKDGVFRTLPEIKASTGDPEASISAQLRHLRKFKFGGHQVNKRRRGEPKNGLFEYQLIVNDTGIVAPPPPIIAYEDNLFKKHYED